MKKLLIVMSISFCLLIKTSLNVVFAVTQKSIFGTNYGNFILYNYIDKDFLKCPNGTELIAEKGAVLEVTEFENVVYLILRNSVMKYRKNARILAFEKVYASKYTINSSIYLPNEFYLIKDQGLFIGLLTAVFEGKWREYPFSSKEGFRDIYGFKREKNRVLIKLYSKKAGSVNLVFGINNLSWKVDRSFIQK